MPVPEPTQHRFRLRAAAAACAALCATAQAQDNPQRVEVTGSHVKRVDAEGASPVQVLRREDIARTGASNVRELLESLSSFTGSLSDIGGSNSFSPGASSASLRNLGKQSTLVLLNFRRVAAYPLADYSEVFSNLDTLPLDVIDRIEILKNGGSALYGTDAMAGVINIITRDSFTGLVANASRSQASKTGRFGETTGSLTGGLGDFAKDKFNVFANLEVFQRQGLYSWRDLLRDVNPVYAAKSPSFGTPSTYAYPGNIIGQGPVDGCTTVVSGLCRYDRYQRFPVQPGSDRVNLLVNAKYQVRPDIEGFSELLYSHIKTEYRSASQAYGPGLGSTVWGNPLTGTSNTFYYRGLPAEHPLNTLGEEAELRYRFVDGPSQDIVKTDQYRLLTGLRGAVKGFDWESAVGVMGGTTQERQRGNFSDSGFKATIGDYNADTLAADFFNKAGGYQIGKANTAEVLNKLFPSFGYTGKLSQAFADGKLSGEIGQFGGRPVTMAVGFDLRRESMVIRPTDNLASGDIVGLGVSSSDASRNFGAVYGEVIVPVTKALEAQAALRADKYPNFGAHFSPKLGLRYQPSKQLLLRATAEAGFRAPNLTESAPSTKFAFNTSVADPKRCDQAAALAGDLQAQAAKLADSDPQQALLLARADNVQQNECSGGVANVTRNNPNLKPETSKSYTFGLVFEPVEGFSASIDYWQIERSNEINTKSLTDLLAQEASLPAGTIVRDTLANDTSFTAAEQAKYGVTAGALLASVGRFENLLKTTTSGIDLTAKASLDTRVGRLGWDMDAVYLLNYKEFSPELGRYGDNLAGRYGYSRWQLGNTVSLKYGALAHSLRYVWNSGYALQRDYNDSNWTVASCASRKLNAAECTVGSYERLDYHLTYSGIKNLELGFHVRNLLASRPPVDFKDFGGTTGIIPISREDVQGRVFKLTAQYRFF